MSVTIITIGKTGKDYIEKGIEEFDKRIRKYLKLKRIELSDYSASTNSIPEIINSEEKKLLKYIKPQDYLVVLDQAGNALTSEEFSKFLEKNMRRNIKFAIGGVYGFSDKVKCRADFILSFSQFTFTHQMIRLLLYEQLYRGINILTGGKYHK